MDLFDFFFPEQAQAKHLRDIARNQRRAASMSASLSAKTVRQSDEVSALREDVKFLTLVVATILKRLAETKTMNLNDVRDLLDEIDALDGVPDGGLDPGVFRSLLGILKQEAEPEPAPGNEEFRIVTAPQHHHRR